VSAVAERPEYVGGPLCGDRVERPEERGVTVSNPKVNKAHNVPGTYVYDRREPTCDFVFKEEL
jgi:hypothetical protein